jgi:hypothetical protein
MKKLELKKLWEKLDTKTYVINLKNRTDRAEKAQRNADNVGLDVEFYSVEKHKDGGVAGCFESHQEICRLALKNNLKKVMILEDDFEGTSEIQTDVGLKALEEFINFSISDSSWDILYLGVTPNVWFEKSTRSGKYIYRMKPWCCTHAMIVSEKYMKEIVTWNFVGDGKDAYDWRHRTNEHAYSLHPQLFKQYESPSDIRNIQLPVPDVLRDVPNSFLSWYALNVNYSLIHGFCIFAIVAILFSASKSSSKQNETFAKTIFSRAMK